MTGCRGGHGTAVMLCQGNVCRSPVAAELLRRQLAGRVPGLAVVSAGMLPRQGARSPPAAILAARKLGIDLETHRSTYLSDESAEEAILLVVFDRRNLDDLLARNPALARKVVMLGSFLDGRGTRREFPDPDGADLATFEQIYAAIAAAVKGLAAAIEPRGQV